MDILLATTNAHKVREIRALLKPFKRFDLYTLRDFPHYKPPAENGSSFAEIAAKKAMHAAQTLLIHALADDSGLVVPALGNAPGINSARYAKEGASDKENRKKLLQEMEELKGIRRDAYFECCIAFASPQKLIRSVCGIAEGSIITEERGGDGFGYDSLFVKHDYNQTFAELGERIKNQISHRGKALQKMLIVLESYIAD
ncbi:MAG: RdgB/HAM1 family non-canonical purine NTP pyrophosphatase [Chlamydiales bacterium]